MVAPLVDVSKSQARGIERRLTGAWLRALIFSYLRRSRAMEVMAMTPVLMVGV